MHLFLSSEFKSNNNNAYPSVDFEQPRNLYTKVFSQTDREHLINNIAGNLGNANSAEIKARQRTSFIYYIFKQLLTLLQSPFSLRWTKVFLTPLLRQLVRRPSNRSKLRLRARWSPLKPILAKQRLQLQGFKIRLQSLGALCLSIGHVQIWLFCM